MSASFSKMRPGGLYEVAASDVYGGLFPIGPPLEYPARLIKFSNNSTADALISWDGFRVDEFLPKQSDFILDCSANKETSLAFEVSAGTQFYIRNNTGLSATGVIFFSYYYAE